MKISWNINEFYVKKVKKVLKENDNFFLKNRIERNVKKKNIEINKNIIIQNLMMCLLTSQQRSGPNSIVGRFLRQNPFPITSELIAEPENIELLIKTNSSKNTDAYKIGLTFIYSILGGIMFWLSIVSSPVLKNNILLIVLLGIVIIEILILHSY